MRIKVKNALTASGKGTALPATLIEAAVTHVVTTTLIPNVQSHTLGFIKIVAATSGQRFGAISKGAAV